MGYFRYAFDGLSVGLFAIIGFLLVFGQQADWAATGRVGIAFVAAVACALIGNLDKFESLKASLSGIEAKTREATKVVEEARATLRELHALAEMTGALLIELMARGGRLGGNSSDYDDEHRGRILHALTAIGLSPDALRRVNAGDKHWISIDYSLGILNRLRKSESCSASLKSLGAEMLVRWNSENFRPTPDDFSRLFQINACDDQEVVDLLEDYRHYLQLGEHRRPEVWRDRHRWLH